MNKRTKHPPIAPILHCGEENAITAEELLPLIKANDDRHLRRLIDRERKRGALIISSENGYYLPSESPVQATRELYAYIHWQESNADSRLRGLDIFKAALLDLEKKRRESMQDD